MKKDIFLKLYFLNDLKNRNLPANQFEYLLQFRKMIFLTDFFNLNSCKATEIQLLNSIKLNFVALRTHTKIKNNLKKVYLFFHHFISAYSEEISERLNLAVNPLYNFVIFR
jgi:hypothetical protein